MELAPYSLEFISYSFPKCPSNLYFVETCNTYPEIIKAHYTFDHPHDLHIHKVDGVQAPNRKPVSSHVIAYVRLLMVLHNWGLFGPQ